MDHYAKFFHGELSRLGADSYFRPKRPDNDQSDGLCLAWRAARFTLLATHELSLAATMMHLPDAVPNAALFAALQDRQSGRTVVVANAHLYGHWDHDSLRAVQARFLFEHLFQWAGDAGYGDAELIVCGDFNSDPASVAYRLITGRSLPEAHFHHVMAGSQLAPSDLTSLQQYFAGQPRIASAYALQALRPDRTYGAYGELPWSAFNTFKGTAWHQASLMTACRQPGLHLLQGHQHPGRHRAPAAARRRADAWRGRPAQPLLCIGPHGPCRHLCLQVMRPAAPRIWAGGV